MMSLQEGEQSLKENVDDEYSEILRVYNYGDKKQAQRIYPKMDRTIKKASIGIQRHSMYFSGKEQVKWIDDSYLMMGKAHFYKQDYISARRVFDYVAKNFEDDPIHYEAYLWLAKTHIGAERFEKADATINLLQSKMDEKDFPVDVENTLPLVLADFYIAQEQYSDSYPYLERSLELNKKKDVVTRVEFILGQINQMEGDAEMATYYFNRVVKRNPNYIMAFEAKMKLAENYASESGDSKELNKILMKMLKDLRNKEFRDQIYYALAEVARKDGIDTLAISYLRKSVSNSISNDVQKTKSSLEVADMFFELANYEYAQAYYDTAVSSLPKEYPNYDEISYKAGVLSSLVIQAQIIKEQDSLQWLANMDTTELYAIIDEKIALYLAEEQLKLDEAEELSDGGTQFIDMNDRGKSNQSLGSGEWYFYNTTAISYGFTEFKKKWGNRKLEDNWRLSDKRLMMQSFETESETDPNSNSSDSTAVATSSSTNPRDRGYYLAGIPNTADKIASSDTQIIDAFSKLGYIYYMELNDSLKAKETYLDFQERYPENEFRLESWYALYRIFLNQNNVSEAEYYKSLIISNYPESTYAKVIINPDYYTQLEEEKLKASELYMRTYTAFNDEKYHRVISYSNRGIDLYPDDTALVPRFMYLRALSLGKVDTPDTLYVSLDTLIASYPTSPVVARAKALIRILQKEYGLGSPGDIEGDEENLEQEEPSIYSYTENEVHFVMFVVESETVKVNPLKIRISDFNNKYFSLMRLKTKSLILNNKQTIITVGNFKNSDEALNFYSALLNDEYVLSGINENEYYLFPISTSNYPLFYRDKKLDAYNEFFEKNYKRE